MSEKACEGGQTGESRHSGEHFDVCFECGSEVRCDMVDHPFWGFAASCPHTRKIGSGNQAANGHSDAPRRSAAQKPYPRMGAPEPASAETKK